ncbi:MAG: hypothetical protein HYV63_13860 [Candidatus Schekmanbacteria bacterium]|nr:hypothetical protein [Candidatus Schekmanbacteria bacterium]
MSTIGKTDANTPIIHPQHVDEAAPVAKPAPAEQPAVNEAGSANRQGFTDWGGTASGGAIRQLFKAATATPTAAPAYGSGMPVGPRFRAGDLRSGATTLHKAAATQTSGAKAGGADLVNSLWYGGSQAYGANVTGRYSEKASYHGQPGVGHPRFATTTDGGDMVLSVTGLHGRNPQPTRVMALDSEKIMRLNGGTWPEQPAELAAILKANPDVILADVQASPPEMTRLSGIPAGTKATVLTGAEALMGNPPQSPPPSQAMITNLSQLPAEQQQALGGPVTSPSLAAGMFGAGQAEAAGQNRGVAPGAAAQNPALANTVSGLQDWMQTMAQTNESNFRQILQQIFGDKLSDDKLDALVQQAKDGSFPVPANVRMVDDASLRGNHGAYSPENGGTILVNEKLANDPQELMATILEESGHHLDGQLGGRDTRGDEGQLFAAAMASGKPLSRSELAAGRADQDQGSLTVDGRQVDVEFRAADTLGEKSPTDFIGTEKWMSGDDAKAVTDWFQKRVESGDRDDRGEAAEALSGLIAEAAPGGGYNTPFARFVGAASPQNIDAMRQVAEQVGLSEELERSLTGQRFAGSSPQLSTIFPESGMWDAVKNDRLVGPAANELTRQYQQHDASWYLGKFSLDMLQSMPGVGDWVGRAYQAYEGYDTFAERARGGQIEAGTFDSGSVILDKVDGTVTVITQGDYGTAYLSGRLTGDPATGGIIKLGNLEGLQLEIVRDGEAVFSRGGGGEDE